MKWSFSHGKKYKYVKPRVQFLAYDVETNQREKLMYAVPGEMNLPARPQLGKSQR